MNWSELRRHLPNGRTRILGIIGEPIDHSLSPQIHTTVLRYLDRNLIYLPFPVTRSRLRPFLREAGRVGICGLNVTTPYKEPAWRCVNLADPETRRTRMVNTIEFRSEEAWGSGTDGAGIEDWLASCGLESEPVGLLGFGSTARSFIHRRWREGRVLGPVLTRRAGFARRTLRLWPEIDRGKRGSVLRGDQPPVIGWSDLERTSLTRMEKTWPRVWVSTLPPSAGGIPEGLLSLFPRASVLLDLNYGGDRSVLARQVRDRGFRAADGLGPLLHQAARSLSLWIGEPVPVQLFQRAAGVSVARLRPSRG